MTTFPILPYPASPALQGELVALTGKIRAHALEAQQAYAKNRYDDLAVQHYAAMRYNLQLLVARIARIGLMD